MGTVKYTGPVASFHCPTEATIRSLKVHFSPKQEGSGDPSPENVRPIVGWDGVEAYIGYEYLSNVKNTINKTLNSSGEEITENGMAVTDYIPVIVGHTYTLKFTSTTAGRTRRIFGYSSSKTPTSQLASVSWATVGNVITMNAEIPTGTSFVKVCYYNNDINKTFTEPSSDTNINYEFGVLGKNKFDYANANIADKKRRDDTGTIVSDATGSYCQTLIPVSPNTTYTLSGYPVNNNSKRIYYIDAEENFIERTAAFGGSSYTFTTPNNCYYIQIQNREVGENASWETLQLELGSTATTYEPYNPNKTVYGGWVDLISGEVCATHTKYIFTGNENFNIIDSYIRKPFVWSFDSRRATDIAFASSTDTNLACNKLNAVSGRFHYLNDGCICTATSSVYSYVLINGKEIFGETNEECNQTIANWYSNGVPLTIIAPLRSEYYQFYHLAPTQLQTFLGQNNVWSNADYVEVEYDLHETQTILARKQFIIANQPHIVKPAAAPLQNFVTDLVAPLKECKIHFVPVQEGTGDPSPENVRPISGWTGVEVYRTGKNILPPAQEDGMRKLFVNNGITVAASSEMPNGSSDQIRYYANDKTEIDYWTLYQSFQQSNRHYRSFRVNSPAEWFKFMYGGNEPQIEFGSTATAYEPYQGITLPIDWTDSAGTVYGGYVDLVSGEVWADTRLLTIDSTTSFYIGTKQDGTNKYFYIEDLLTENRCKYTSGQFSQAQSSELFSHGVIGNSWSTATNDAYTAWVFSTSANTTIRFAVPTSEGVTTVALMQDWIAEHGALQISYPLATPTLLTTLTPTALRTLIGTNNIWSNANGNIELSYWKH